MSPLKKIWAFGNMLRVIRLTWARNWVSNMDPEQEKQFKDIVKPHHRQGTCLQKQLKLISNSAVNAQLWQSKYRSAVDREQERPCVGGSVWYAGKGLVVCKSKQQGIPISHTLQNVTGTGPHVGQICMNTRLDIPPHAQTNKTHTSKLTGPSSSELCG